MEGTGFERETRGAGDGSWGGRELVQERRKSCKKGLARGTAKEKTGFQVMKSRQG